MLTSETIASLPGGWDLAHVIRLGIKPFAELGANSEALSGSQVDSPCSCRAIFELAPVTMLQSLTSPLFGTVSSTVNGTGGLKPRSEQQSETDDEKSYEFRTGAAIELALYHSLGASPGAKIDPQILLKGQNVLSSSFHEKLYNRCSAHSTPVAPAAPLRHRALLASAPAAGAPLDAR